MTISSNPYDVPLEAIDMSNPDIYQQALQHDYFERLRRECPVHYSEGSACGPFWSLTKYEDIIAVDSNHRDFSADAKNGGHVLGYENWFTTDPELQWPMFLAMDPPKHNVQRKAVSPGLSPDNLKRMEVIIRKDAAEIMDSLPEDETFNWVTDVSIELTTRTLALMFDFPFEERKKLTHWSDYAFSLPGDGLIETWNDRKVVMMEMKERFDQLRAERQKKSDGFDMITRIANPIDGKYLSDEEYMGNVILLLVGGNDTTRNSLTASALTLNMFPDQEALLRANQNLIPSFCSDVIRWQTPLPHMKRTALKDVEIRGQKICKGEKIAMWYISGNRDEDIFERPHELIIDRPNARNHLSFGFGNHRCLGNRLAELQLRIAWEEILKRFKSVALDGEPVRNYSHAIMGYSDLPVRVTRY